MIHVHMSPFVSIIRVYDQPNGYETRAPYTGILTVTHKSPTHAYLSGARGVTDRETRDKVFAFLRESGFATLEMERHGEMKTIDLTTPTERTP